MLVTSRYQGYGQAVDLGAGVAVYNSANTGTAGNTFTIGELTGTGGTQDGDRLPGLRHQVNALEDGFVPRISRGFVPRIGWAPGHGR